MALNQLHKFLVIAGVLAVPAMMASAWMTIYSPWLGIDDSLIIKPKALNAVQFALAFCGAIGTAALCFWAADNIRPVSFISRRVVAAFISLAIACAFLSIALALVEFVLSYRTYVGDGGEPWISTVGYSLWSAVSTLVFLPVLLFARAQLQLRSQNAPLSGSKIGAIFE